VPAAGQLPSAATAVGVGKEWGLVQVLFRPFGFGEVGFLNYVANVGVGVGVGAGADVGSSSFLGDDFAATVGGSVVDNIGGSGNLVAVQSENDFDYVDTFDGYLFPNWVMEGAR